MKKLLILLGMLCLFHSKAQESLSLAEAIRVGLENNYDIIIEENNVEVARLNNTWGETNLFPSLSASLVGSYNSSDNRQLVNPFAFLATTNTTQSQPSLNLNWDLLQVYDVRISKRRLEQLQAESEGNADIVIQNTLQSIILGYYLAVLEKERLDQFQDQLDLSRDKYDQIQIKKELGSAITADLLLEEGNYLADSTSLINQQLAYQNALSNLNFVLGMEEPAPDYTLSDSLDFELIDLEFQDLINRMERDNADLKTLYLTQSVLHSDYLLSKSDRYPSLSFGANYTYTKGLVDISDWPAEIRQNIGADSGTNENVNWGGNFTISFTLFNGGRINRAIQRASLQENIGEMRVERLKVSLRRDLKQAYDQYNTRKQLLEINQRRRESAQQNLEINTDKFSNGTINSFDYRTIQNTYLVASIQELQSIYDMIDSKITLLRLTGGLLSEYN
ncbi:MAG: TolC family protein [Ekhidna sp.]|nr:TolC family protein [Ekhidna sp.]